MQKWINWPITICVLLLLSISILVILSSSKILATQQFIFALAGLIVYFIISNFDYKAINNLIKPGYFLIIFLLLLVFLVGFETRGSLRWIPLGFFNIQPSEFAKPVLMLFLASYWVNKTTTWKNIAISFLWFLPIFFFVFKQPDLGTTIVLAIIWSSMLFFAKINFRKILVILLLFVVTMPIGWFSLQDYQKQRISSFLAPGSDPLGVGYNIIQSTISVGSGELIGRGLGRGTQSRLQFLPEFRTDFIFAAIAEEMGFLGSMLILNLYLFLIIYCLLIAQRASDYQGFLIASGVAIMLLFQTIVNIGMNIGLLPITGITLPLISYGGSSLLATLISLGLVGSVSRFSRKPYTSLEQD